MRGVTIRDHDGRFLSFDLRDILQLLEPRGSIARWRLFDVDASGEGASELMHATDLTDERLREVAGNILQIIEGNFSGFKSEAATPFVVITAIRSSEWDVECDDPDVLSAVRRKFQDVTDLPEDQ